MGGWGTGAVWYVLETTGHLNCFPPASSRGHLVSNSQHAAFLYEKNWNLGIGKVEKRMEEEES